MPKHSAPAMSETMRTHAPVVPVAEHAREGPDEPGHAEREQQRRGDPVAERVRSQMVKFSAM